MKNYQFLLLGLGVGIVIALIVYLWQLVTRRKLKKKHEEEIDNLKNTLLEKMEIESSGIEKLKADNEELKRQNENLRVTNASLVQKPGRAEIQRLAVYQTAIEKLIINSPGFGAAWQTALNEAEVQTEEVYNGSKSFLKRIFTKKPVVVVAGIEDSSNHKDGYSSDNS